MTGKSTTHLRSNGKPCGYPGEHAGNCRSPEGYVRYLEATKRYHQGDQFKAVRERWANAHPAAMALAGIRRDARKRLA